MRQREDSRRMAPPPARCPVSAGTQLVSRDWHCTRRKSPGLIHGAPRARTAFLCKAEDYPVVCTDHILLVRPPVMDT